MTEPLETIRSTVEAAGFADARAWVDDGMIGASGEHNGMVYKHGVRLQGDDTSDTAIESVLPLFQWWADEKMDELTGGQKGRATG